MTNVFLENTGLPVCVQGETIFLSGDVVKEFHRQENIRWAKDLCELYLPDAVQQMTNEMFEEIAKRIGADMSASYTADQRDDILTEICDKYNLNY